MDANMSYERQRYTDYEISRMVKSKMNHDAISLDEFCVKYEVDRTYVSVITSGNKSLSTRMVEISAEFLEMSFNELTEIDCDDKKCYARSSSEEDKSEFIDFVSYMFSEMILQKKMAV